MIERSVLDALPDFERVLVTQALVSLSNSRVWRRQEIEYIRILTESFHVTDDEELLKKIRMTQEFIKACRTMQGLGDELKKELNNA